MVISSASKSITATKSQFFLHADYQILTVICRHRVHDLENQGLYSNPTQYYDFLQNRVMILFRPKFEETDAGHPEFHLTLSKKQNYDLVRNHCSPY